MRKSRNLVVEGLENRSMLAGNVAVSVSGGTLNITGDFHSNGVSVQELDTGKYFVTGFGRFGDTTVNGHAAGAVVSGVTQGIHVVLNDGDDIFVMSNSKFRRDQLAADFSGGTAGPIQASPEAASGSIHPVTTRVFGNLSIDGGDGKDGVGFGARVGTRDADGHTMSGTAQVIGGLGDDHVIADRTETFDDMLFDMGDGNDIVHADKARVGDFLFANLGAGGNSFSSDDARGYHSQLYGGSGADGFFIDGYHFNQEVIINAGDGDNNLSLKHFSGLGAVSLLSGSGNDKVNVLGSSTAGNYTVNTGAGNDSADLSTFDVHLGTLSVTLGDGNDNLRVAKATADHANFDGGAGDDTYTNGGTNTFGSVSKINFEHNA